ncbi:hypothetical protein GCM10007981_02010 [Thermocladium modestius]|uniref:6-hydroxymethyl-7,8-dihydropterin pyrophosphokinase n=1 Tax=Thermocladium modestius TaxID=62609 RepID=A0A830GRS6_9CREN|nr:6-hydroxymethylpterin diphosphokinase MptE-like protein [Thermocladium modestius]GGP19217.1 hypothetical protein GCM10007981_02010 [Thermocladium modestius]
MGLVLDPLEYELTRAIYSRIPGLNFSGDAVAAREAPQFCNSPLSDLRGLDWSEVTIVMPALAEKPRQRGLIIAVEGRSLSILSGMGIRPDVVVTDFDFEPEKLIGYDGVVLGHAHGDNMGIFKGYAGRMARIIPTVQSWPTGCSILPPGFTDGDRAAYIAAYMGARIIHVYGFKPDVVIKRDDAVKRAKLDVAKIFMNRVARIVDVKIY